MTGILGTALSGLMASQRAMDTTSHNIANVNTDGYSRQRVELTTRPAEFTGAGYIGQGVNIATVSRRYDQFITNQLTSSTSAFAETNTLSTLASQVDNIISNEATSLSPALNSFFNAVNGVANDPSSVPARQVMVSGAESLTQQFNTLSSRFEDLRKQTNDQMQASVDDINSFAKSIASLNSQIVLDSGRGSGEQLPNDLLDQRDALVNKLAEKVSVSAIHLSDGSVTLFMGTGQSLVLGATSSTLSLAGSSTDSNHKEILLNGQNITQNITGGALNGALRFRDEVLDPAQQQLGLVSAGFAVQFNAVHTASAFDLNGNAGTNMFGFGTPTLDVAVVTAPGSTGSIAAVYDPANAGSLNPSDYRLDYDDATATYSLTRLSDNTLIPLPATFPGVSASVEGMTITEAVPPTVGLSSSFLIRPTLLAMPVVIAPGSTGSIAAFYDPANTGSLNPSDYRLDYDDATATYSLTRLSDNTLIPLPATFPGASASVEGMIITEAAPPTPGLSSSFLIRPAFDAAKKMTTLITDPVKIAAAGTNIPGPPVAPVPGDNTVALSLANLEKKSVLLGGNATFNAAYGQLVAKVGTLTQSATTNSSAQEALLNQAKQNRENLAGVNLDEEAANLIKFQQSYQAAAQAIAIANSLFDTLIGAVR